MVTPKKVRSETLSNLVVAANGNLADVARKIGRTRQAVQARVKSPAVQKSIKEILARQKITIAGVTKKLREGLSANEIKYFAEKGVVQDERDTIDYQTRHKYAVTILQLLGYLKGANGMCEPAPASGDIHFHHTQVFQDIDFNRLKEMPYADCVRTLSDRLSKQRS